VIIAVIPFCVVLRIYAFRLQQYHVRNCIFFILVALTYTDFFKIYYYVPFVQLLRSTVCIRVCSIFDHISHNNFHSHFKLFLGVLAFFIIVPSACQKDILYSSTEVPVMDE